MAALSSAAIDASAQNLGATEGGRELRFAIGNVAIGAATAGVWSAINHRPVARSVGRGALAGLGVFAGKRIIANGRSADWWIGRQLASIASSEVANAGRGAPVLDHFVLPAGPVRLHVNRRAKRKITPKIDVLSAGATAFVATREGTRFAWKESLATGTLAFLQPEVSENIGGSVLGVMTISELAPNGDFPPLQSKRQIMSHELIHNAQYDFIFSSISDPLQSILSAKSSVTRKLFRYVDVNLAAPLQIAANGLIDYNDRPWEREARYLAEYARTR